MAETFQYTPEDVSRAEAFLVDIMGAQVPDADISVGSANRDFTVKALAALYAHLRAERAMIQDHQSLRRLEALDPSESVDDAVDEHLSNWFLSRKPGNKARIATVLHFSQRTDTSIPGTNRFGRTSTLIYLPPGNTPIPVAGDDMRPEVDSTGAVTSYVLTVSLEAEAEGEGYNVSAGRFSFVDSFSPYFLYAENLVSGVDGTSVESTSELLARAPRALTVRNLINLRSADTTLQELFPSITALFVARYGDVEQVRDLTTSVLAGLRLHRGGFADICVATPRTKITETLEVGGAFVRADGLVTLLRDAAGGFLGVVNPGNVLQITAGLTDSPRQYIVKRVVSDTVLEVHSDAPMQRATDEDAPATLVTYSVGCFSPAFVDKIPSRATGSTSRTWATSGEVLLAGRPHYWVDSVEIVETATALTRVNGVAPAAGQYSLEELEPTLGQTMRSVCALRVPAGNDTKHVRVTYDTLADFDDVAAYVDDPLERIAVASVLAKGFHPIYLAMNITYKLGGGATAALDSAEVIEAVRAFVDDFDPTQLLDASAVSGAIRDAFPSIGVLYPLTITYYLAAPDGQLYAFSTRDVVTIAPSYPTNNAKLVNETLALPLRVPILNAALDPAIPANTALVAAANVKLAGQISALGVSDRCTRYLAQTDLITVTQQV